MSTPSPCPRGAAASTATVARTAALVGAATLACAVVVPGVARAAPDAPADDAAVARGAALEAALRERLQARIRASREGGTQWLVAATLQADAILGTRRLDGPEQDTLAVSSIPFGDAPSVARASVRQSQIDWVSRTPTGDERQVWTRVQVNLFGPDGSTRPQLAQGFVRFDDGLLVGKTYSTFMDDSVLPATLDYNGPSGVTFVRQPMVRGTLRPVDGLRVDAAAETPQADARAGVDGLGAVRVTAARPDLAARLRLEGGRGHLQLAGLSRRLDVEATAGPASAAAVTASRRIAGHGVSLSGSLAIGDADTLSGQWVRGRSIGRYFNDGVSASGVALTGDLRVAPLTLTGATLHWRHAWSTGWSSTLGASRLWADADTDGARREPGALRALAYASANLVWRASATTFVGVELQRGEAVSVDGGRAATTRVQLGVRWLLF
ncbi:MAG: hypothetical protein RJA99_4150 [Pseudomonadota bacterium]|jgi:hypothetical protein